MAESIEVKSGLAPAPQVIGLIIGPLAWGADLLLSYSLVQHSCSTGHYYVLHLVSAICFVIAVAGAVMSWRHYLEVRHGNDEGGSPFDRSHFLTLLGMVSSIAFAIVIIAGSVPRWILSPCD